MVCRDLPDAPDLLENAIILRLRERPAQALKSRSELDRRFSEQHPKAFGSLVKACSLALEHRKTIKLDAVHNDAELERWNRALDKGLNLGGKMLAALQHNLEQTLADIVKERPAIRAFVALVKAKGTVKATATQLLDEIEPFLDGPKDARYPTTSKQLRSSCGTTSGSAHAALKEGGGRSGRCGRRFWEKNFGLESIRRRQKRQFLGWPNLPDGVA